jgi:putative oxidoreductase
MSILAKLRALLATVGEFLQSPLLLVIRLYWGWQFMITGKAKLMNIDGFASHFHDWGIPYPKLNVVLAGSTESLGGLLLLLGLFSRFASPALMTVMCVAYATANRDALDAIFSDSDKFVSADPFLFLLASAIVFAFGPGKISLDALIFKGRKA